MTNFQLQTYLATAPLGNEAKHNLTTIFYTLTDARKLEILGNWPKYLDMLLKIEQKGKEERDKNIQEALQKIENIISDGMERDRQKNREISKKNRTTKARYFGSGKLGGTTKKTGFSKKTSRNPTNMTHSYYSNYFLKRSIMKSPTVDNFQRFAVQYPNHILELNRLKKIINNISDEIIQKKVYARVNVELGVVLLENEEVGVALNRLLQLQFTNLGDR